MLDNGIVAALAVFFTLEIQTCARRLKRSLPR